ncbi:MAG: hypothetical protein AB7Q29_19565 [Vicinamibacterales bacterium]
MPQFTIEIDDKGDFVGQLPTEIDAILKRIETTAHGKGFGAGSAKAAEEAKKQIEDTVRAKVAEFEARQPLERERYENIEKENTSLKTQVTDIRTAHDRTLRAREEQHAEELNRRVEALRKRDTRIADLVNGQIRSMAIAAGCREESIEHVALIIGHQIGFTDDMEPFIKAADGSPLQHHGKAVTIESHVRSFMDSYPNFRKPTQPKPGQGGRAASFQAGAGGASADEARQRVESGDRSPAAINDLFLAGRKKSA